MEVQQIAEYNLLKSLIAGGVAGLVVDVVLFPIDTIKTRLQTERGFWRSGGFSGIYRGLGPAATGSAPTAALFFCTYEGCKSYLQQKTQKENSPLIHMVSASMGEVVACFIRVPVEIAKQRRQALIVKDTSSMKLLLTAYKTEGLRKGVYRGFFSTIFREIPFSLIQFPLWEYFKLNWTTVTGTELTPFSTAICGACAGGIAAGITTPLDVIKTRIMLADQTLGNKLSITHVFTAIIKEKGVGGLFAGVVPRVLWITLGGAFFFGFYDLTTRILDPINF